MHLSSVLLPEPLRPTSPKNSPFSTWKLTCLSASNSLRSLLRIGCSARSLSVCTLSAGSEKRFETSSISSAGSGGAETGGLASCTAESLCVMQEQTMLAADQIAIQRSGRTSEVSCVSSSYHFSGAMMIESRRVSPEPRAPPAVGAVGDDRVVAAGDQREVVGDRCLTGDDFHRSGQFKVVRAPGGIVRKDEEMRILALLPDQLGSALVVLERTVPHQSEQRRVGRNVAAAHVHRDALIGARDLPLDRAGGATEAPWASAQRALLVQTSAKYRSHCQ